MGFGKTEMGCISVKILIVITVKYCEPKCTFRMKTDFRSFREGKFCLDWLLSRSPAELFTRKGRKESLNDLAS